MSCGVASNSAVIHDECCIVIDIDTTAASVTCAAVIADATTVHGELTTLKNNNTTAIILGLIASDGTAF